MIFDEPTLGLDLLVARAVLQNIERLRDEANASCTRRTHARGRETVRSRRHRQQGQDPGAGTLD